MGFRVKGEGKGDHNRLMTPSEFALIKKVFRTARLPRLDQVQIADGVNHNGGAWTDSDYQINVGPRLFAGDLSALEPDTLVHEMTHVWQYYNGTLTKAHAAFAQIRAAMGGFTDDLYKYDLDGSWYDMGFEGQAQMVEDWYTMGQKEEGYRYFFMKQIVWSGNKAAERLTRIELVLQGADIGTQEEVVPDRATAHEPSVPLSDSYLISLLQPRYAADDVVGFGARARKLEEVFRSVSMGQALALFPRLVGRLPKDKVSVYFHDHLSTPTRTKLRQILQDRMAGK
jgi:hypothetical protein